MSRLFSKVLFFLVLLLFVAAPSSAHQPRWVEGGGVMAITAPEISKAYYGELVGAPQEFRLRSATPIELYVEILVPDLPRSKKDFRVDVLNREEGQVQPLILLNGVAANWTPFFEEFTGDKYLRGPSSKTYESGGEFLIRVYNSDNRGKYVLVVGDMESFPPAEIWNVLKLLPRLKSEFFEKPVWTAYFNYSGLFVLILGIIFSGVMLLFWWVFRKRIRRSRQGVGE